MVALEILEQDAQGMAESQCRSTSLEQELQLSVVRLAVIHRQPREASLSARSIPKTSSARGLAVYGRGEMARR